MGADRAALLVLFAAACAGAPARPGEERCAVDERFPVRPCEAAARPEAVGVWQNADHDYAIVYDGCEVRFPEYFAREPPMFSGLRNIAGTCVVDVHAWGDPPPYYRMAAVWRGDELCSASLIDDRCVARWDGSALVGRSGAFARARSTDELGETARMLLCVERVVPSEASLARRLGVELRERAEEPPDYVGEMMSPYCAVSAP